MTGIPISDLYILIADGEGATSTVVNDLRFGLHKLMCCCNAESPEECGDEVILGVLRDMEDHANWTQDEAGKPFSFTHEHESGSITITRLFLEDVEVAL